MFFKCLKYDLKCGFLREYKKYLMALLLFVVAAVDFTIKMDGKATTVLDYLFYLFSGMEEFYPAPGNKFRFPALWIALILFSSYITLYYPFKDLNGFGKSVLLSTGSKKIWFLSKCAWIVISTVVYFVLAYITLLIIGLALGNEPVLKVSADAVLKIVPFITAEQPLFSFDGNYYDVSLIHFLLPIIIVVMLNLLQLFLSLFIKPFFSFIFTAAYSVISAYSLNSFMLLNFAMIERSNIFISNGVDFHFGLFVSLMLVTIIIIAGTVLFSKQDIINRE